MVSKKLAGCSIVAAGEYKEDWTPGKMKSWVEHAGGRFQISSIEEETTHLVASEKAWTSDNKHVQRALELQAAGHKIFIVKYEWLEDSFEAKTKRDEKKYVWNKPGKASTHKNSKAGKDVEENPTLATVLLDHTKNVIDPEEVKTAARKRELADKVAREEREAEAKRRESENKATKDPEIQNLFSKANKKAEHDILSKGYHIYEDNGFPFNVILTKINMAVNQNERYSIKLYESDGVPHTYAVNGESAATQALSENKVLAAIGSNWHTAFRVFRQCFEEKTEIKWEQRVAFFDERTRRQQERRTPGHNGLVAEGKWSEGFHARFDDFARAPYLYRPPQHGPRGFPDEVVVTAASIDPEVALADARQESENQAAPSTTHVTSPDGASAKKDIRSVDPTKEADTTGNQASAADQAAQEINPFIYPCGELPTDTLHEVTSNGETGHTNIAKRKSETVIESENAKKEKLTLETTDIAGSGSETVVEDPTDGLTACVAEKA